MKSIIAKLALGSALVLCAASVFGCSDDDNNVDATSGKAISDLDIGGDVSIDRTKTQQMTATIEYADGTSKDVTKSSELVWNIGNPTVATITAEGVVTGIGVGATNIKATYQGKESAARTLVVK